MGQGYRPTVTTVSLINYRFVFCPRHRRRLWVGPVAARLKPIIREGVALEIMPDHGHLFLNALPIDSPTSLMAKIKGRISRPWRREFSKVRRSRSLWTRSYLVS